MTDYSELKRLAEAATPGPWAGEHDVYSDSGQGERICKMASAEDSAFISAANPSVVLSLIAENEELKHAVSAGAAREWDLRSQVRNAKESRARVVLSNKALRKDAERYRWLRDSSESIHQFYLSTPIWFTGVKFSKENVDSTIDAAMSKEG